MIEATFVLFVPKAKRAQVRGRLAKEASAELKWRERKMFSGSEFYFSGPAAKAREFHSTANRWLQDRPF